MDYQRLVSYIYSYPEGVKGRNVGFAKALVHQGQFKLNISLRGVKTDSPEMFGIYMMVADSGYRLIKLGECLVKMGQMEYSGVFNPDNINDTGYSFRILTSAKLIAALDSSSLISKCRSYHAIHVTLCVQGDLRIVASALQCTSQSLSVSLEREGTNYYAIA